MKLFESRYYLLAMYLSTMVVCILILFSFLSLVEDAKNLREDKQQKNKITGFTISENKALDGDNKERNESKLSELESRTESKAKKEGKTETREAIEKQELYSTSSYLLYVFIIIVLISLIFIISVALIFPAIKNYT